MKVALVHELLIMKGGAERVLRIFARMFPDAPIYTLLYDEKKLGDWFPRERVRTSIVQTKADRRFLQGSYNHHLYLKDFPAAVEAWDFSDFDLVISSSSAFAHGIITNGAPKHLCYVHSPARYLWDRTHDVLEHASHGPLGTWKRRYLEKTFHELRIWDSEVAPRPDCLIAASKEVQRRIQLYWDRNSSVVYPPIDDAWFTHKRGDGSRQFPDYFLIVSTLAAYKRIDLAIEACNRLKVHLNIVGEGAEQRNLERMAGPTIHFYGYRQGDELMDLVSDAKALIVPGEEDFGLAPIEAQARGTPVIAYGKGGLLETVKNGETGMFFMEKNAESLMQAMTSFDQKKYSIEKCRIHAEYFRESFFVQKMNAEINALMKTDSRVQKLR